MRVLRGCPRHRLEGYRKGTLNLSQEDEALLLQWEAQKEKSNG